jgi:hypothetical protein
MAGKEVVKGTFGNESIELNNAATEATLSAMLRIAQKDSAVLAEMAKKAGVDSKKIQDSLGKGQPTGGGGDAGKGMGILGGAAKMAGGVIADLAGGVMQTAGNLLGFSNQLLDGTAKASDLAAAFKDLPLGIGLFAQAMSMSTKYFEANLSAYKSISNSGAGLVGSLDSMKIAATRMGLSLDEYGAMFSKNGDVMTRLGGSMSQGSKNLVNMNQSFMASDMGKNLLYLGYSYAELNDMIPNYIRATGDSINITKDYATEVARIQKASAQYGEDLDFLARMTGKSREEAQRQMQETMNEASFQMWLLKQPKEQQEAIREALARELAVGGKGLADLMKAKLTGFAGAFSKEGQAAAAIFGDGTRAMDDMIKVIKSGLPAQEKTASLDKLMAKQISSNIGDLDKYSTYIMSMGQGADGGAKALLEFTELTNKYRNAEGGKALSQEKIMEIMKKVRDDQIADAKKAKALADQDLVMKKLSADFQTALLPIMKQLNEITQKLVKQFDRLSKTYMPAIQEALEKAARFISQVFEDPAGAWEKISGWFKGMLARMFEAMTGSRLGKMLFGDAAASLNRQSKIESMQGIDATRYEELEKMKERNAKQEEEYQALRKQKRDGELALAQEMREKAKGFTDADKIKQAAIDKLSQSDKYKGMGVGHLAEIIENANNRNGGIQAKKDLEPLIKELEKSQAAKQAQYNKDALQVELGNKSLKDLKGPLSNVPEFANGTVGSGKLVQNFGNETLAKLHGKEAVLTEDQLTNFIKGIRAEGTTVMQVGGSEILAEQLITLNRQAAMQNKILNQMVENQRTMLNRTHGNRLMA